MNPKQSLDGAVLAPTSGSGLAATDSPLPAEDFSKMLRDAGLKPTNP